MIDKRKPQTFYYEENSYLRNILVLSTSLFSQSLTGKDYLKRSKNQKTVGWVLLGGGTALIATAYLVDPPARPGSFDDLVIKGAFVVVGALSAISSVPFFIASGKNKRRARSATAYLKMEGASAIRGFSKVLILFPAASIKIRL